MNEFQGRRLVQQCEVQISAPAEKVFPLLCPVREYDWIETWDCDLIYSQSGVAENNCVFRTIREGEGEMTWVVSRYEPNRAIEFIIFRKDDGVLRLDLELNGGPGNTTVLRVTSTMTGLNMRGNAFIEHIPDDFIRGRWEVLGRELNHYLASGEMLKTG